APSLRALEVLPEARDRVEALPWIEPRLRAIGLRVVARRVAAQTIRERLDERRPFAAHSSRDGISRRLHDREDVVAVDAHAGDAVRDALHREALARRLSLGGDADGPTVVATEKDRRRLEDAREVEPVVELVRARRAFAEVDERHEVVLLDLRRPREADRLPDLR